MDDLQATYKDDLDDDTSFTTTSDPTPSIPTPTTTTITTTVDVDQTLPIPTTTTTVTTTTSTTSDPIPSEDLSDSPNFTKLVSSDAEMDDIDHDHDDEDAEEIPASSRKRKSIEEVTTASTPITPMAETSLTPLVEKRGGRKSAKKSAKKKTKAKGNNVWTKPASRKGKKRTKSTTAATAQTEDAVMITPVHRHVDKNDDGKEMTICLSKVYKAEKVELSEDRMSAGSCKGYRMVRATRGVMDGAWYFEIKVVNLGETGHTRLGWCMEKGDLQAPVGYDGNSYGYRDVDGSKVHKALREKYGEGRYVEGDVIGFYINLPDGNLYAPKSPKMVMYKGQRYTYSTDSKEVPPKVVPGSEICFFKNGVCQGSAFKDLHGGCYYPAASMYTLPHQSNCVVKFNFGPDFEAFPEHFGERPIPKPMVEVPYHNIDSAVENGIPLSFTRTRPMLKPESS